MASTVYENDTHFLSRADTNRGVVALVNELNLYGGSNGTIQLYHLIAAYLRIPEARAEINKIVEKYEIQAQK